MWVLLSKPESSFFVLSEMLYRFSEVRSNLKKRKAEIILSKTIPAITIKNVRMLLFFISCFWYKLKAFFKYAKIEKNMLP